jgi:Protein of unknown function (DUF1194)
MSTAPALRWFACLIWANLALSSAALAEAEVDLELVLAVDVSRSMDGDELQVQRDGYVAAFRHPEVLAAIASGPLGRIAVTYVEWAGPDKQVTVLPWTLIDSREAAYGLAARLSVSAFGRHPGTSISGGLMFASATFANNGYKSIRQVIDISGDGPNNRGLPVEPVRAAVIASGVTINGLPLMIKAPFGPYSIGNLDVYYEDCVIGGPGAFLIPVYNMSQLALAIRRKLVLEIAGLPPAVMPAGDSDPAPRTDCLIGEKLIERWLEK